MSSHVALSRPNDRSSSHATSRTFQILDKTRRVRRCPCATPLVNSLAEFSGGRRSTSGSPPTACNSIMDAPVRRVIHKVVS